MMRTLICPSSALTVLGLPELQQIESNMAKDMVHGVPRCGPSRSYISSPDVLGTSSFMLHHETKHISCTQTWEAQQHRWVAAFAITATIFLCAVLERAAQNQSRYSKVRIMLILEIMRKGNLGLISDISGAVNNPHHNRLLFFIFSPFFAILELELTSR